MRRKNVFRNRNVYMTKNGLEVNSDNKPANFCAGCPGSESHCQFSQSGCCGFYLQGLANLGENKKILNTVFIIRACCMNVKKLTVFPHKLCVSYRVKFGIKNYYLPN